MIRIGIDIGGTFTDLVLDDAGKRTTAKVLTTPDAPERAVLDGLAELLQATGKAASDIGLIVHGTTLATNAIIERKGARTALVTTEGFRDTLEIADEGRFDQYDVFLVKPAPLVPRRLRFTVPERIDAQGRVRLPLDEAAVLAVAGELAKAEVESVAISFLHAYTAPDHERRTRDLLAAALPSVPVSLSAEVCPEIREYERVSTTVANAYVQPLMAGYLGRLETALAERGFACPVYLMTSGGGLTTIETARRFPIRLVESGPAGGAILAAHLAQELEAPHVLSFDMGGTTAKICLIDQFQPHAARTFEVDRSARFMKGSGFPVRIPVIEMVEIGAGGGSIARIDDLMRVTVGPESAGSVPGPVAYGRGGVEPTVTDADLVLGRFDPDTFAGGRMRLDVALTEQALVSHVGAKLGLDALGAAHAVAEIVDENMANASRVHGVESGADVAGYTMIAFGGAAPVHALRVAQKLGVRRVVVPADAGVGSAIGFLLAPIAYEVLRSAYMRLDRFDAEAATALVAAMRAEAEAVVRQGAGSAPLATSQLAYMRYVGQGHEVAVALPERPFEAADAELFRERFEAAYAKLFARMIPGGAIEILTWSVTQATAVPRPPAIAPAPPRPAPAPIGERRASWPEGTRTVPVYRREDFAVGAAVDGPCLIEEATTTTVVAQGWRASLDGGRHLVLDQEG
ncbi:MAG: hydantoinase/oxoprolinase family protein [Geminicoccaceae bacterium]|nr:MAG: hydantoinase/oxoprolinase family protein [Geminicoccaceae bacterium]